MLDEQILKVKVMGDYACFTRPELKVERMSYPCMTISAARGILDSILWKPEFKWYVRKIYILQPIKYISIKRNEVNSKSSGSPVYTADDIAQRTSIILKDVAYVIEASIWQDTPDPKNKPKKYAEMFSRRVRKGQCYRRPYLGTREFSCEFSEASGADTPIDATIPIGSMFYDMYYDSQGKAEPINVYDVTIKSGILEANDDANIKLVSSSHIQPQRDSGIKELLSNYARTEEADNA